MFNRVEFKTKAKAVLRKNYWTCFLIALIYLLINGNTPEFTFKYNVGQEPINAVNSAFNFMGMHGAGFLSNLVAGIFIALPLVLLFAAATIILQVFVINVLEVGVVRFFIDAREDKFEFGNLGFAFREPSYKNIVKVIFFRNLYIFLWTLLLVIPGVIARYRYRFIPYILADNASIDMTDAFELSKEMTNGIKMDLFILDLSFFGWRLLNLVTFGLANFFIEPYVQATNAEVYHEYLSSSSRIGY